MRAHAAECLLSLVTPRAHAATITGDLLEGFERRHFRFWSEVGSVALGLLAANVREAPLRTLWVALLGLLCWSSTYVSVRAAAAMFRLLPFDTRAVDCCAVALPTLVYLAGVLIVSSWLAGCWLGNRIKPAAALNACVPLAVIWTCAALALPIADWRTLATSPYCLAVYLLAVPLCYVAPLLAGGALGARYRAP